MTFTPTALRKNGFPRAKFSHEQILDICRFYQNLLKHLRGVQDLINEALDEFQHAQSGRPTPYTIRLVERLASIDAGIRMNLHDEILQVELAALKWEGKSAKLRAEAKRQQRLRDRRRGRGDFASEDEFTYTAPGTDPFGGDESAADDFANVAEVTPPLPAGPAISPTMAIAQRGMAQLPQITPAEVPTNATYKKSGLV